MTLSRDARSISVHAEALDTYPRCSPCGVTLGRSIAAIWSHGVKHHRAEPATVSVGNSTYKLGGA